MISRNTDVQELNPPYGLNENLTVVLQGASTGKMPQTECSAASWIDEESSSTDVADKPKLKDRLI